MHARVLITTATEGSFDELSNFWSGSRGDAVRERPGNEGFLVIAGANGTECVAVSLWDDAASADASQSLLREHVEALQPLLAAPPKVIAGDVLVNALG